MNLINRTSYPTLTFEGIDQLGQSFQTIVLRQTYTWNEKGQLIEKQDQHPIHIQEHLADPDDKMSAVLEESDLAHYKPNCDLIIKGHAYPPIHAHGKTHFQASIHLQVPNSTVLEEPTAPAKYPHIRTMNQSVQKHKTEHPVKGKTLIDKTLNIYSPHYAIHSDESIMGKPHYNKQSSEFDLTKAGSYQQKVSLSQASSFGGYCIIEENDSRLMALAKLDSEAIIPTDERNIRFNPDHGTIAYMVEDEYNPAGTGFVSSLYAQAVKPTHIKLPQILPNKDKIDSLLIESINQMVTEPLAEKIYQSLTVGFGVCPATHPNRQEKYGKIDDEFINSEELLPTGFDFAVNNCAYPDQQTAHLRGNEWLTLTNLCQVSTTGSNVDDKGNVRLRLALPGNLLGVSLTSASDLYPDLDIPLKLDTVVVSPDEEEVSLVWRAMVMSDYQPKSASLFVIDKQSQEDLVDQFFVRFAKVDDMVR